MTRHDLQEQIERGYMTLQDVTPVWLEGLCIDFAIRIYEPCHAFWLSVWTERRRREIVMASKKPKQFNKGFFK